MKPARHILVPEITTGFVMLKSDKLKHLRKVLRLEWNEFIYVADGNGQLFEATLEKAGESGGIRVGACVRREEPPMAIELVVGMPKNATMDWVVEKAVECGVSKITPVVTSRSVVRPESPEKYLSRWQSIMDGALEQSERLWRPLVCEPLSWKKWVATPSNSKSFAFVSEGRHQKSDREAMQETWAALRTAVSQPIRAVIGPEGGFSEDEIQELLKAGFTCLSLGNAVLRVETAAIAVLAIIRTSQLV